MLGRFELGFALIDLEINNAKITAIIDTGFNGELLLPEQLIKRLNLKLFSKTDYVSIDTIATPPALARGQEARSVQTTPRWTNCKTLRHFSAE